MHFYYFWISFCWIFRLMPFEWRLPIIGLLTIPTHISLFREMVIKWKTYMTIFEWAIFPRRKALSCIHKILKWIFRREYEWNVGIHFSSLPCFCKYVLHVNECHRRHLHHRLYKIYYLITFDRCWVFRTRTASISWNVISYLCLFPKRPNDGTLFG